MRRHFQAFMLCVLVATITAPMAHSQVRLIPLRLTQADPPKPAPKDGEPKSDAPKPAAGDVPPAVGDVKPGPDAPPAPALKIVITALQNNVQVRLQEGQPWQTAKVGMILPIGAEVRTALRSICQFTIDGNHTITLDRLGVIKVLEAINKDGRVKTDVGMKYGRTQYKVEPNAQQHDSRVHAPAATLVVRGSELLFEDDALFGARALVLDSDEAIYEQRGIDRVALIPISFVRGTVQSDGAKSPHPASGPALTAYRRTINDTGAALARASQLEADLIAALPLTIGDDLTRFVGTADFRQLAVLEEFTKGLGIEDGGGSGAQIVQGQIFIQLNWTGAADLNVFVIDSLNGRVSTANGIPPGFATSVRSGGPAFAFAGSNHPGPNGFEDIRYNTEFPAGDWTVGVQLVSGTTALFTGSVTKTVSGVPTVILTISDVVDTNNPTFTQGFNVPP